jgi:hypothetical protein
VGRDHLPAGREGPPPEAAAQEPNYVVVADVENHELHAVITSTPANHEHHDLRLEYWACRLGLLSLLKAGRHCGGEAYPALAGCYRK